MKICDKCDNPATHTFGRVIADVCGYPAYTLYEATVNCGDLCTNCMDKLAKVVNNFMNEKEAKKATK